MPVVLWGILRKRVSFQYNDLNVLTVLKWIFKFGKEEVTWDCHNTEPFAVSFEYRKKLSISNQRNKLVD